MKKVKLQFKLTLNNYLFDVRYFYIEKVNIHSNLEIYRTGAYTFEGTFEGLLVMGKLDIDLSVGGIPNACIELDVTVDGKKITGDTITCCANPKGIAILDNNNGRGYEI